MASVNMVFKHVCTQDGRPRVQKVSMGRAFCVVAVHVAFPDYGRVASAAPYLNTLAPPILGIHPQQVAPAKHTAPATSTSQSPPKAHIRRCSFQTISVPLQ